MPKLCHALLLVVLLPSVSSLTAAEPKKPADEKAVRDILDKDLTIAPDGQTVKDICLSLGETYGLAVRIDTATMKRLRPESAMVGERLLVKDGPQASELRNLYELKIEVPIPRGMTVADLLTEVCTQMPGKWSYRVRNTAVLIGPAFEPPATPGTGGKAEVIPLLQMDRITEQLMGESVSFSTTEVPLATALEQLRKRTGANIVLDQKVADAAKAKVTGTFNDARLFTVLQVLSDMTELKVVSMNNVFYVTEAANADRLQAEHNRELFGEPALPATPAAIRR